MIRLVSLKNTFLLSVFITVACGSSNVLSHQPSITDGESQLNKAVPAIQRTEAYLPQLKGKQIAVVANPTSVIANQKGSFTHLVDTLLASDINVVKVFAPEHGFRGDVDAGETVADGTDKKTGLPLISLYGSNKKPSVDQLNGIAMVVFDIQDVGVRFYTYISTLHLVMEACAEQGIAVMVLDRPNPNGAYVDGPTLEIEHSSFLGKHPIPLVHGMTIGEYAQMINGEGWLENGMQCALEVITMEHYNREMTYSLPVRPSPNLPNDQSIALYPSLGLFEGTHVNAGRGTEFQFQRFGAPFLNSGFFDFTYTPQPNFGAKNPKHNGVLCYGRDLASITPEQKVNLEWLIEAYTQSDQKESFFKDRSFTLHAGTEILRKQIEQGMNARAIRATWQEGVNKFKELRAPYLLYP